MRFLGAPSPILAEYDTPTDEALSCLVSALPTAVARDLLAQLNEALSERELLWRGVLPAARKRMKVQDIVTACVDTGIQEGLHQMHEGEGLGRPTRGLWSSAPRTWTTPGFGGSTLTTVPPWSQMSMLNQFACGWAAQAPLNL